MREREREREGGREGGRENESFTLYFGKSIGIVSRLSVIVRCECVHCARSARTLDSQQHNEWGAGENEKELSSGTKQRSREHDADARGTTEQNNATEGLRNEGDCGLATGIA